MKAPVFIDIIETLTKSGSTTLRALNTLLSEGETTGSLSDQGTRVNVAVKAWKWSDRDNFLG